MNYVNLIAFNNNIEKIKLYRNFTIVNIDDIRDIFDGLKINYTSNSKIIDEINIKLSLKFKKLINCQNDEIYYLEKILRKYHETSKKVSNTLNILR